MPLFIPAIKQSNMRLIRHGIYSWVYARRNGAIKLASLLTSDCCNMAGSKSNHKRQAHTHNLETHPCHMKHGLSLWRVRTLYVFIPVICLRGCTRPATSNTRGHSQCQPHHIDLQRQMPATRLCSIQKQGITTVPCNAGVTESPKRKLDRFESMG